jgi:hypothetical protein
VVRPQIPVHSREAAFRLRQKAGLTFRCNMASSCLPSSFFRVRRLLTSSTIVHDKQWHDGAGDRRTTGGPPMVGEPGVLAMNVPSAVE